MPQRLLVASPMDQPGDLAPGLAAETQERLAQLDPMVPGQAIEVLDRPQQQVRVSGMGDRLGLHRGVHRDPLASPRAQRAAGNRHAQRLGQQQFELISTDPATPARHRGAIQHEPVPEIFLAAKILPVRVLHPPGADLLVRQSLHVLDQVHGKPGRPFFSL